LSTSDSTSTFSKSKTQSLPETLSTSDQLTLKQSVSVTLPETLTGSDMITAKPSSITLRETITSSDQLTPVQSIIQSLPETLSTSDQLTPIKSKNVNLPETLSSSDATASITQSRTITLPETLSSSDSTTSITQSRTITLPETLSSSDATTFISKTFIKNLSETLSSSDGTTASAIHRITLPETLSSSDSTTSITQSRTITLPETLSSADNTAPIQTKSITLSDTLASADTIKTAALYNTTLTESLALSDTIENTESLHTTLTESLGLSDAITTTTSLHLSLQESMNMLSSVTVAKNLAPNQDLVDNSQTQITVDPAKPQLVIVDSNAALSQITIPSTVTNPTINYSSITQTSGSVTSVQITNQLNITKNNGNSQTEVKVTIPASTSITGTSWNGVLELPTVQSSANLNFPVSSGQVATPQIVIGLGSSVPLTFSQPVRILLVGQAGQHVGFFHNTSTVTEITAICTSDDVSGMPSGANECKIDVPTGMALWTFHFTGFATWSSSSAPSAAPAAASAPASSGAGGGSVGVGPSSGPSFGSSGPGASEVGQGGILTELKILDVSYDTCDTNTVKILVAYSDNNPSIILRTSVSGIVSATPAKEQPFAAENENATIKKLVYEAPINSKEKTFEVLALQAVGHDIYSVGKTIEVTDCHGEVSFEGEQTIVPLEIDTSSPRIFDVKFQLDNGTKIPSSEDNHVINSGSITVYAIVDSKTSLDNVELRFVKTGDPLTSYNTVKMNVAPTQISNSTYLISGTISKDIMQAPALTYWISVHNSAGKITSSNSYSIGVMPSYPVVGNIDLDTQIARIEGTTAHPTAYYTNNSTGPVYGRVVLLVNGTVSYASPSQIFATGQNVVSLQWKAPTVGKISQYQLQARAEIFGKSIDMVPSYVTTFPGTSSLSISKLANVTDISIGNSTVAKASTLYSSFKNDGTMRFKVTASDGTCVIGASDNCLVTKSTLGLAGNFKSVTIGDHIYRIRYTGPDDALERFSITSVDSMSGNWKVEIDSVNSMLPLAQAMDDVTLKVKYRAIELPFITAHQ
ncbi:MAG: hypothetical protein KGI10_07690, partial [Thaumarchaeota archaeon]|nr:hypothetical protein [Nitrososphaerota archaeon]